MDDLISRQKVIEVLGKIFHADSMRNDYARGLYCGGIYCDAAFAAEYIKQLPVLQETCEGCKHLNKCENEVECGYNSPCTTCKRRVADHYER